MDDHEAVLAAIASAAPYGISGAEIGVRSGLGAHRTYPVLASLEARREIESEWEVPEPRAEPRRRLYWLAPAAARDEKGATGR